MITGKRVFGVALALSILGGAAFAARATTTTKHKVKESKDGKMVAVLCDGETSVELNAKEGEEVPHEEARRAADVLMKEWREKNPHANWEDAPLLAQNEGKPGVPPSPRSPPTVPAPNTSPAPAPMSTQGQTERSGGSEARAQAGAHIQSGQTYGNYSERDQKIWAASTEAFVKEGDRIFHDAKKLGSTTAMSCDMCHPNAANTHPETYPKYQVQLGRVALLRDMINWCIENPVRGKPLQDSDPSLRALEAFIYAQRKGVALDYGKH